MRIIKKTTLLFFIISLCLQITYSKNYYIDAIKGDDSNNGNSVVNAWRSIDQLNKMWSMFKPGDSILFKRGQEWMPTNKEKFIIQIPVLGLFGTKDKPIVMSTFGLGKRPIISSEKSKANIVFMAFNISYVNIEDIEFRGEMKFHNYSKNKGAKITNIKIINVVLNGIEENSTYSGIDFYAQAEEIKAEDWKQTEMNNIEIAYCTIRNDIKEHNSGIQLYGQGNNWIHHNKIFNSGKSGINFAEGNNNVIEYNLISGTTGAGIKHSVHSNTADNIIIRGNLILNTGGIGLHLINLKNSEIYNNTIFTNKNYSFIFGWNPQSPVPICGIGTKGFQNNIIQNNIFVGNSGWISIPKDVRITYKDGTIIEKYEMDDLWLDNIFQNNIIYNPSNKNRIYVREYISGTHVYSDPNNSGLYNSNLVWDDYYITENELDEKWLVHKNISNDLFLDPMFKNGFWNSAEDFGDFSLNRESPGKSSGIKLDDYNIDLFGNNFRPSSAPNRGAILN